MADTLREIVRELAEISPWMGHHLGGEWCFACNVWRNSIQEKVEHRPGCLWLRARAALREPAPSPWREVTEAEPPLDRLVLVCFKDLSTVRPAVRINLPDGRCWRKVHLTGRSELIDDSEAELWQPLPTRPTPQQSTPPQAAKEPGQ